MAPKKMDFLGRKVDHQHLGLHSYIGAKDHLYQILYRSLVSMEGPEMLHGGHGGIFNLEFSPDGSILVAATEGKSILMFDPLSRRLTREVKNAHADCVNNARFSENGVEFQRVFYTNGLMRMRLTPDSKKMVICTTGGYLMVIHDLNLRTLAYDLRGFKLPKMHHWQASGKAAYHVGDCSFHYFTARRNRVELICDFPSENDAEIISSLQVHPHGWCVLSRNTSRNEKSEVKSRCSMFPKKLKTI
ncbi:hypothetical protein HPB51_002292 [Rhipicephalus microplus]|uniref:Wd40 domain protein n=1 Tax=Rhipicephalus microplus TaxID=6941 RepID=A0A9J6D8H4_RHIMP|nr:hypothetical protein HPB51_002292 [Rhipicephalus microplus]